MTMSNSYLLFRLKEHYRTKSSKIRIAVIFLVTGLLMFSDHLLAFVNTGSKPKVFTEPPGCVEFAETDGFLEADSKENADIVLTKGHIWTAQAKSRLPAEVKRNLENAIMRYEHAEWIPEVDVREEIHPDFSLGLILLTFLYFESLSKGTVIAGEIVDDKLSGMSDMILSSMNPEKHMNTMIRYAWLTRIIDGGIFAAGILFWGMIRLVTAGLPDLADLTPYMGSSETSVLFPVFIMIAGMWFTHRATAVYVAKVNHPDQVAGYLILPNVLFFIGYFVILDAFQSGKKLILAIAGFLPVLNSLAVPLLYKEDGWTPIVILGAAAMILYNVFLYKKQEIWYRKRILS